MTGDCRASFELYPAAMLLGSVGVAADLRGRGLGQQLTEAALTLARAGVSVA